MDITLANLKTGDMITNSAKWMESHGCRSDKKM